MNFKRLVQHLVMTPWRVKHAFPAESLATIQQAIAASEATHGGEIRFAVEGALDAMSLFAGQMARARAIEVFSELRVWDTEANNGVLIYLLLADRDVEIVADRGIHARVGTEEWERICQRMEAEFRQGNFQQGVLAGIEAISLHLKAHFPTGGRKELPDAPVLL